MHYIQRHSSGNKKFCNIPSMKLHGIYFSTVPVRSGRNVCLTYWTVQLVNMFMHNVIHDAAQSQITAN